MIPSQGAAGTSAASELLLQLHDDQTGSGEQEAGSSLKDPPTPAGAAGRTFSGPGSSEGPSHRVDLTALPTILLHILLPNATTHP